MNPPAARNSPSLSLRPVAPPDGGFLLRLYATTRAPELAKTNWDAAQQDRFVRSQYNARHADYTVRYPGAEHSVITIQGQDAGVWMVWRTSYQILLVNIELLPAHRGQGVGSALLRLLLAEGKILRLPVHLSVRDDNHEAQRLYRKLGFSLVERTNGYRLMRRMP